MATILKKKKKKKKMAAKFSMMVTMLPSLNDKHVCVAKTQMVV